MVKGDDSRVPRRERLRATSSRWSSPAPATRPSAPAATPRNTPSTTPAIRRNTGSYMRLFNDMVSAILACDKPVICRVNGMRIGGGQEIGMACDFSIAQDLARFGQAGPKHGSAPIGGATDFLPYMIGCERAMVSGLLCEPFSAHKAYRLGIISDIVPALKVDGKFVANPTGRHRPLSRRIRPHRARRAQDRRSRCRRPGAGEARHRRPAACSTTRSRRCAPSCSTPSPNARPRRVEELRKPKLEAWNAQQGKLARLAGAQHDDRSARRLPRLQRRHARERIAKSISWRCARRSPPTRRGATSSPTASSRGRGLKP